MKMPGLLLTAHKADWVCLHVGRRPVILYLRRDGSVPVAAWSSTMSCSSNGFFRPGRPTCAPGLTSWSTPRSPRWPHEFVEIGNVTTPAGLLAPSTVGGPVEGATPNGADSPVGWQRPGRSHQWRSHRRSLPGCDPSGGPEAQRTARDPGCRQAPCESNSSSSAAFRAPANSVSTSSVVDLIRRGDMPPMARCEKRPSGRRHRATTRRGRRALVASWFSRGRGTARRTPLAAVRRGACPDRR